MRPGQAAVLLAKPVPRWSLLAGKFAGVLAFVAFQALVFVASTWLALGVRTDVWGSSYFLCVPILLLHFAVFFSFSTMLAVAKRSTVACAFGSILFWLLCWAMNFGRHSTVLLPDLQSLSPLFEQTIELGYWVLPKPLDFHFALLDTLRADHFFTRVIDVNVLAERGAWLPGWSVAASVAFAVGLLAVAAYDFVTAVF